MDWMVLAENAMEPCSDADGRLFYAHALPEPRRVGGLAGARRSPVIEYFTRPFEEIDTWSVSGTRSWESSGVLRLRRCVISEQNPHRGYVILLDFLSPVKYAVL